MFWLSHHRPEGLHRTYRVGGVHLCARCLGTYPALLLSMALQFLARAPLAWRADDAVGLGLLTPALLDWAVGRFHPRWGSNGWRTATGVLLGLGLGRSLYIHVQAPWPRVLVLQAAWVTAVVLPVIFLDPNRRSRV